MKDPSTLLWDAVKDSDRKRGFLTKRDREYIFGNHELDGQEERDLRYRIRRRVENGLLDAVALDSYEDEELEKVLSSADYPLDNLIVLLYSLAFRLLWVAFESNLLVSGTAKDADLSEIMEDMLLHSITREERDREGVTEVEVDIEIKSSEFDEDLILNRILAGNATIEEFWTYEKHGDLERLISQVEAEGKEDEMFFNIEYLRNQIDEE
jgi:hypothetical protein